MAQKVFATKGGKANFFCPECGKAKQLDVSRFSNVTKQVKLKCTCTCKHVFSVILERRMHIRKKVDLKGTLQCKDKHHPVTVIDISRYGLKINTKEPLALHPQDRVVVEFVLDDPGESKVSKEAVIRTVRESDIGLEFLSRDHYDKFGTYLLFHFN